MIVVKIIIKMKSLLNKCYFAMIKANKQRKVQDLCIEHINACRQLLKIGQKNESQVEENCKKYMLQRASQRINTYNSKNIFRLWQEIRPIESEINILSFSKQLNSQEIKYINNVAIFWGNLLIKEVKSKTDGNKTQQQLEISLQDYHKVLNYLIYLMTPNQNNLVLYLRFYISIRDMRLVKEKNHSQLRYVFDKLLLLPSLSEQSLGLLLFFTSKYPLAHIYHTKQKQMISFIYSKINIKQVVSIKNGVITSNLIYNLIQNAEPPMKLVSEIGKLLNSNAISQIKLRTFVLLCQVYIITKHNIRSPLYLNVIKQLVKQTHIDSWIELSRILYLIQAWIPEFWIPYFQFMSRDNNHLKPRKSHHYIIDDLLSSGEGGEQLQKQALSFKKALKSKDYDLLDFDIRKQQQKYYGKALESKFSYQMHIANSLRLICMGEVLTEVAIKYFLVDVLINKKVIIEINNTSHYKIINGETLLNLKSSFRERVLTKAGYILRNLSLSQYSNQNYATLQQIYKIVEETKDLKQFKKKSQKAQSN